MPSVAAVLSVVKELEDSGAQKGVSRIRIKVSSCRHGILKCLMHVCATTTAGK